METAQQKKLIRYLRNANPFMWGVLPGNKANVRNKLVEIGMESKIPRTATYANLLEDLIDVYGIEIIIKNIEIIVKKNFTQEDLDILRRFWRGGRLPDTAQLKRYKLLKRVGIFLKVNNQINYVENWTTFAGLWFEEINPVNESWN